MTAEEGLSRGTAYERYKETTRAFRDAMERLVPAEFRLLSVSDLAKAADYVLAQSSSDRTESGGGAAIIGRDKLKPILDDLEESIRLREAVAATYLGENSPEDDGHSYMIQILKYCRKILVQSRQNIRCNYRKRRGGRGAGETILRSNQSFSASVAEQGMEESTVLTGFGALQVAASDSEDDDSDDAGDGSDYSIEVPSEPPQDCLIEEDLINGTWAFRANLFFLSAENLFEIVADAYQTLNEDMNLLKASKISSQDINHQTVLLLLQTTATVNLAIDHMKCLEKSFFLEHGEPFHSVYHVLAVLVFPDQIKLMEDILGQKYMEAHPEVCVDLASTCIRFGFLGWQCYLEGNVEKALNCMIVYNKKPKKRPGVSQQQMVQLTDVCYTICASADFERNTDPKFSEDLPNADFIHVQYQDLSGNALRAVKVLPPQWLKNYGCLGGPSGIMYTFAQIEKQMIVLPSEEEQDGARLSEDGLSLESTREITDTICGKRLFPHLFAKHHFKQFELLPNVCRGDNHFSLCAPYLREFHNMMTVQRGLGVDFVMAFANHALVYGMFLLQKGDNIKRIAVISKLSAQKFENQLDELAGSLFLASVECTEQNSIVSLRAPNRFMAMRTENKGLFQATWNPLLAGSLLLQVTFHSNMRICFRNSDIVMQVRTTLHLYNALRRRSILPEIDVLEMLVRALHSSPMLWPSGGRPKKGGFLESFFLAVGDFTRVVEQYAKFLKIEDSNEQVLNSLLGVLRRRLHKNVKHLEETEQNALVRVAHMYSLRSKYGKRNPGVAIATTYAVSSSYKYMHIQDFPRQIPCSGSDGAMACSQQAKLLSDGIHTDQELLCINWLKVGYMLDELVAKLVDTLSITPLVEEFCQLKIHPVSYSGPTSYHDHAYRRDIANKFLGDRVFREIEFQENPELCPNSLRAAKVLTDFFVDKTTAAITFF